MALGSVLCVMAAKDTPHRILFRPFCALVPDGTMGTSPFALMWVKLWRVTYTFAFTGWLPVDTIPENE